MNKTEIKKALKPYYEGLKRQKQIVTVILRTHERPEYTKIMIQCILRQTYKNFFLVIIDNDSKDDTPKVIQSFRDERIIFLEWDKSLGSIMISTFKFVRTKYLVCFHDDDYVNEHYLESFLETMESNENYSCLSCVCDIIDSNGKISKRAKEFDGEFTYNDKKFLTEYYINGKHDMWIPFPPAMYRMKFYEKIEQFLDSRTGPAGDQYIWMQTERYGGTIAIVGKNLFQYRVHNKQVSQTQNFMEIKLFNFLLKSDYYGPIIKTKINKFSWIIVVSLKMSLRAFKNGTIKRKQIKLNYHELPTELKRPLKCKMVCLLYRISICFPRFMCFVLRKKIA